MSAPAWIAAACAVIFAALGWFVSARPPTRVDVETIVWRGQATALAVFFTRLGRWYAVVAIAAACVAAAAALHRPPAAVVELFVAQVLGQGAVNALKAAFRRRRPDEWLHRLERGFSYPSGHATTAAVFFLGLVLLAAGSHGAPHRFALALVVAFGTCVVGLPWSRVALGAHYLTDVAGGFILGVGWLSACVAVATAAGAPLQT